MIAPPASPVSAFISRWKASGASERANYQLFLSELCELLGVEKPRPASGVATDNSFCFERPVSFHDGEGKTSTGFIDLYKRDHFVLEAKQGADKEGPSEAEALGGARVLRKAGTATRATRHWDRAMKAAKEQAHCYAKALPAAEGWPPFLVVVDREGLCLHLRLGLAVQPGALGVADAGADEGIDVPDGTKGRGGLGERFRGDNKAERP